MLSFQPDSEVDSSEIPKHFRGKEGKELWEKLWNLEVFVTHLEGNIIGYIIGWLISYQIKSGSPLSMVGIRFSINFLWAEPRASAIHYQEDRDPWPGLPGVLLGPCARSINRSALLVLSTSS